jgi:Reverse transcriptase (RNA-dependent DNA polymerase)
MEDQWKAVFITNEGLFEPRVMFFGLTNSPATFQTMMNGIFAEELRQDWLTIYMDDILVHTPRDKDVHRQRVHQVLKKLADHDLFLKPEKCQFEQLSVKTHCYTRSGGLIQSKGSAGMPKAVYD